MAESGTGISSASATVGARTLPQPDVLTVRPLALNMVRLSPFHGPVAILNDANAESTASSFIAIINWGDGKVSGGAVTGGNGTFTVSGTHTYAAARLFTVEVTVTMIGADQAEASSIATAHVVRPLELRHFTRPARQHPPFKREFHSARRHTR
jgi:hypothetical protein